MDFCNLLCHGRKEENVGTEGNKLGGIALLRSVLTSNETIMPLLFIFFGLRFQFYSNDHEPIHVHVVAGKGKTARKAKFNVLPEINLVENDGLKANELKIAEMVIEENREIIIQQWHKFFGE